jgi:LPXTG-site transpeptidase (sortase) family protein
MVTGATKWLPTAQSTSQLAVKVTQPAVVLVKAQPFAKPARPKLQHSQVLARRAVPKQVVHEPAGVAQAPRRRSKAQTVLVAMAILVFGLGLLVNIETLQTNHSAKAQVAALSKRAEVASTSSTADNPVVPGESKPPSTSFASYQVAPDTPKLITIAKLGVKARVKPVGVTSSNELGTPASIYDTGWYNASAKPGSGAGSGAMLIDGHVHGPSLPGVFADIKKLAAGDTIEVTRGDNQIFKYTVVNTETVSADSVDVGKLLTSIKPGKAGLNLITCGGKFNAKTQHYEDRTIVYAVE